MNETQVFSFSVVCHTEDCMNSNSAVEITAETQEPSIVCGPCGNQILDITPVST